MISDFLTPDEVASVGFAAFGEGVRVSRHALFLSPERIHIGEYTRIDAFCVLAAGAGGIRLGRNVHLSAHVTILGAGAIDIGDFSTISVRCSIFGSSDDFTGATLTNPTVSAHLRGVTNAPVRIGAHVILGTGWVVLPGVTIGESSAIGALSLVKQDVPALSIAVGTPARVTGRRRAEHRELAETYLTDQREGSRSPTESAAEAVPAETFAHVLAHLSQLQQQVNWLADLDRQIKHRADFLWHALWAEASDGTWIQIGNGRLESGQVTTGSIFYHRYLASIGWDALAYRLDEPGDWNRIRKIKVLRPRMHFVDRPLLRHFAERRQLQLEPQAGERFLE